MQQQHEREIYRMQFHTEYFQSSVSVLTYLDSLCIVLHEVTKILIA